MKTPNRVDAPVLKVPKRQRPDQAGKPLSKKELEILHWAKAGKTVWEISVIRDISEATVKFHLGNIYSKLEVTNRAQAVGEAVNRGLLS
ncbi:helix-turn-helix transcriptional regulator [Pseudomonas frederiksbergensis]|uniref:Helix-turn-helix transcriptional regulator n=1 Tax=Pseudomonas frederiksbergensis TaxID=104087 RepID=A0A1J0EQ24_9PSED|nr:helix-turn-helix transcriptional regulator [Pseudomonas frederiksbergensis]APC18201.1 helix-turn-helix transcriptional regulator [Pseudomonas frederiksbergensis]